MAPAAGPTRDSVAPTQLVGVIDHAAIARQELETIVDTGEIVDGYHPQPVDIETLPEDVRALIANVTLAPGAGGGERVPDAPRVLGSYILLGPLGTGGSASELEHAVEIRKVAAPRRCVVRRLPAQSADPLRHIRFVTEARLGLTLTHAGLTRIFEVSDEPPFLVREYVDGATVDQLFDGVAAGGAGADLVVSIGLQVAQALSYLHLQRDETGEPLHLVHGELSGATVIVNRAGAAKITDPSLARLGGQALCAHDQARGGRSGYRAPEQLDREPIDGRTDLFALGMILFELVLGRRLSWDGSYSLDELGIELMQKQIEDGEIPEALHHLLVSLTAGSPDDRPAGARDVVRVLQGVARQLEISDDPKLVLLEPVRVASAGHGSRAALTPPAPVVAGPTQLVRSAPAGPTQLAAPEPAEPTEPLTELGGQAARPPPSRRSPAPAASEQARPTAGRQSLARLAHSEAGAPTAAGHRVSAGLAEPSGRQDTEPVEEATPASPQMPSLRNVTVPSAAPDQTAEVTPVGEPRTELERPVVRAAAVPHRHEPPTPPPASLPGVSDVAVTPSAEASADTEPPAPTGEAVTPQVEATVAAGEEPPAPTLIAVQVAAPSDRAIRPADGPITPVVPPRLLPVDDALETQDDLRAAKPVEAAAEPSGSPLFVGALVVTLLALIAVLLWLLL